MAAVPQQCCVYSSTVVTQSTKTQFHAYSAGVCSHKTYSHIQNQARELCFALNRPISSGTKGCEVPRCYCLEVVIRSISEHLSHRAPMCTASVTAVRVMQVKQMIFDMAGEAAPVENSGMQLTQATRHARRIYVGGLPPSANEDRISNFFSYALAAVGGTNSPWRICFRGASPNARLFSMICVGFLHLGVGFAATVPPFLFHHKFVHAMLSCRVS